MHDRPISKIADELLRLRHDASRSSRDRTAPPGFGLDGDLVARFVSGRLDAEGKAALADEVARVLPFHYVLPNTTAEELAQVVAYLDGEPKLIAWLDRYPGLPRLGARLYVLMGLLDGYSENPAVVTALRESRERTPVPPGLAGALVPGTGDETLAGLAYRIEDLFGDGERKKAVDLALATVAWLRSVAPRAEELDKELGDMDEVLGHAGRDIEEADAEA
ncbi:hypothetical protein [Streptomyces sp. NPDC005573]|uniref:hypothetical protein n=1 Tax=unclassified Streptomyces TaxID=2593676 RepID=UPI0033BD8FDF